MMNKKEWRKELKKLRDGLSTTDIAERSSQIMEKVWDLCQNNKVNTIHTYLPLGSEVQTETLIERALQNKVKVVVPKTLANRRLKHLELNSLNDLVEGRYGTRFPKHENEHVGKLDIIIIPALGFDRRNFRLGYGSGYYDVFLSQYPEALKVGVGFDFQKVNLLPVETHDIALDEVVLG